MGIKVSEGVIVITVNSRFISKEEKHSRPLKLHLSCLRQLQKKAEKDSELRGLAIKDCNASKQFWLCSLD